MNIGGTNSGQQSNLALCYEPYIISESSLEKDKVSNFSLKQNYPNPFNSSTKISYTLPEESKVKVEIYNLLGQKLAILVDKNENTGNHNIVWNANNFPTGTYLCKIKAEGVNLFEKVQKLILLK